MAANLIEPIEIYRDDYITVFVMDEQGAGGAHHVYHIYDGTDPSIDEPIAVIPFQEGVILENGVNGVTNEALLAIIGHRLNCFQQGPFPSDFNKAALSGVDFAKVVLGMRTKDRQARGVEGQEKE